MKHSLTFLILAILCVLRMPSLDAQEDPVTHRIEVRVYQVMTNITGNGLTSRTQPGPAGSHQIVHQKLDDVELVMEGDTLTWDGEEEPDHPFIKNLSNPTVVTLDGETASIIVGDNTKLQYFVKREDDLFELKELAPSESKILGLIVTVIPRQREEDPNEAVIDFDFEYNWVADREKIEGVELNVGKPLLERIKLSNAYETRFNEWLLHTINIPSRGYVYLFLKVRLEESEQ